MRRGIGTAAAALVLAAPTTATAATWTVDQTSPAGCGGTDTMCQTLTEAATAAGANDTVVLTAGQTHAAAATVTFAQNGLTVRGQAPLVPFRSGAATTLAFTGTGAKLEDLSVVNTAASGTAVRYTGGGTNRLTRAYVVAEGGSASTGVEILSPADSAAAKTLAIDSSVVTGGSGGVGIRARTAPNTTLGGSSGAGPITVAVRHLTTAGQGKSVVLNADANSAQPCSGGTGTGTVTMTTDHSIVHPAPNAADHTRFTPAMGDVAHCATAQPTFTPTATDTTTPDSALFRNPAGNDWLLRADAAAAIDKGTDTPATEETDVDGDPRRVGGATDWGADEFLNRAPAVLLVTAPATTTTGELVAASAEGSSDPEAGYGGGIVSYAFDWGDGTAVETGTDVARAHRYAAPGQYTVTVAVTDRQGGSAARQGQFQITAPANQGGGGGGGSGGGGGGLTSITQLPGFEGGAAPGRRGADGDPPAVAFRFPLANQRVRLGRARTAPMLHGRVADVSGVRRVEFALMRRRGTRCQWYDGVRAFRTGPCTAPRWIKAVLDDFAWRFAFPRNVRPLPGAYFAFVRATDFPGNATASFTAANAIAFRYAR